MLCTSFLFIFLWPESSHMTTLNCKGSWELEAKGRTCIVEQNSLYPSLESGEQEDGKNEGTLNTCWDLMKAF